MLKRNINIAIVMMLTMVFAISARPGKGMGQGKGKSGCAKQENRLKEVLNLSDSQLKKIEKIRIGTKRAVGDIRHTLKQKKLNLHEKAIDGAVSKSQLKSFLKEAKGLQDKIHSAHFKSSNDILDVLNEKQIKVLSEKKMFGILFKPGDGKHGKRGCEGPGCASLGSKKKGCRK